MWVKCLLPMCHSFMLAALSLAFVLAGCRGGAGGKARGAASPDSAPPAAANNVDSLLLVQADGQPKDSLPPGGTQAPAVGEPYSERQLSRIMDTINRRMETAPPHVRDNVYMWGVGRGTINVSMRLNTEAARRAFRKYVCASPALSFSGSTGQELCTKVGVADTLGVSLRPAAPGFPADAETAEFVLANDGGHVVQTGESYSMAVERGGRWYELPAGGVFHAVGIEVRPGGSRVFVGRLHPLVNNNRPGRYRFFKDVRIEGRKVTLMCDFRLVGC